jgi:formylglycine-generating enzyme required for sulfatase activity
MEEARLKPNWVPESDRVSSGGFWSGVPKVARVADRVGDDPGFRNHVLGFRVARNTNHKGDQHEKEG